jgi:hypothetical protein
MTRFGRRWCISRRPVVALQWNLKQFQVTPYRSQVCFHYFLRCQKIVVVSVSRSFDYPKTAIAVITRFFYGFLQVIPPLVFHNGYCLALWVLYFHSRCSLLGSAQVGRLRPARWAIAVTR